MELNSDFISIQSILTSVVKTTGDFQKIKYKGGNEEKINAVTQALEQYFQSKKYVKQEGDCKNFKTQLHDIVLFVTLNTSFQTPLNLDEYSHLLNIIPQFSKCLLCNVVFDLELCDIFADIIEKLPILNSNELLVESLVCLKGTKPKHCLIISGMFLKCTASKLDAMEPDHKFVVEVLKLVDITNVILRYLVLMLKPTEPKTIGYVLLRLYELLIFSNNSNRNLSQFLENVCNSCSAIVRMITVSIFCCWAEVQENDQNLQTAVAEKAYVIVEKYRSYEYADELLAMITSMARRPRTIKELIRDADMETVILNANKQNEFSKLWFQKLFDYDILSNASAIDCVTRCMHLCEEVDVKLLLSSSIRSGSIVGKNLTIKCAAVLSADSLIHLIMGHLFTNGIHLELSDEVAAQIHVVFNKINELDQEDLTKNIALLIFQNPKLVMKEMYNVCLKNQVFVPILKEVFYKIRELSKIKSMGCECLLEVARNDKPKASNCKQYIVLFNLLLGESNFISQEDLMLKVILPLIKEECKEKNYASINYIVQVLNAIDVTIPISEETSDLIETIFTLIHECRTSFLEFDMQKQEIVSECVEIVLNKCQKDRFAAEIVENVAFENDPLVEYYKKILYDFNTYNFLLHVYPDWSTENHAASCCKMIQILTRCVRSEWLLIAHNMSITTDVEKVMKIFTDSFILISQLVETQEQSGKNLDSVYMALNHCLQNYAMVVEKIILIERANRDEEAGVRLEAIVAKQICNLIRTLPVLVKEENGIFLLNLISDRSLKYLANDKMFIRAVAAINNSNICKVLAIKMKN